LAKINFGQVELDIDDYERFLLGKEDRPTLEYIYPTKPDGVYFASELPLFFERAQKELEDLLSQIKDKGSAITLSPQEKLMHEFHLVGHGNTGTNRDGKLTGWSGDMPCHSYLKIDEKTQKKKLELGGIDLALLQAGEAPDSIAADIKKQFKDIPEQEIKRLVEGIEKIDINRYYLRFISDLPRAIAHAVLLTGNKGLADYLAKKSHEISQEIEQKGNLYSMSIYKDLMQFAIANGFIPTPLLRAQYYGSLELAPERLEKEKREDFVEDRIKKAETDFEKAKGEGRILKTKEFDKTRTRQEAMDLADALIQRKNLLFAHTNEYGNYTTEDRFDLVHRLGHFYNTLIKKIGLGKGPILVITSSGCIDVSPPYFRYLGEKGKIIIDTPSKKERGKVVAVKLGEYGGKVCYLNDPKRIEAVRDFSAISVGKQRIASLDEKIREPTAGAIIPIELLRFERKEEPGKVAYEPHPISIEEVLRSLEPTLLLGNVGQGKSTGAIGLADRLNIDEQYVAVHITAADINAALHNQLSNEPRKNDEIVLNLLSRGIPLLPQSLRSEYKFVFIIDALDEISSYRENIIHIARDKLKEYGKVIVTSRFTGLGEYENPGFTTLHLDPQAVIRNLDKYLALRITDPSSKTDTERLEKFKDFLMKQDEGVKTNYLLVYFLTDIYNKRPQDLGDLKGTVSEGEVIIRGIELALWDQKLAKRRDLKQAPRPYGSQPPEEFSRLMQEYEAERASALAPWMDFLQRAAAYKTVHDLKFLDRKAIEEVYGGWTLARHLAQLKGR